MVRPTNRVGAGLDLGDDVVGHRGHDDVMASTVMQWIDRPWRCGGGRRGYDLVPLGMGPWENRRRSRKASLGEVCKTATCARVFAAR